MTTKKKIKRASVRFEPDPGTVAWIDLSNEESKFQGELVALVSDEAHRGCGLVVLSSPKKFKEGGECRVKVGHLPPLRAKICWVKELDTKILKLGLMYLE